MLFPPPENTRQITADKLQRPPMSVIKGLCRIFGRVSPPPTSSGSALAARLVTVNVSHYAEKVRWGFDILASRPERFSYVEDAHPPALNAIYTTELDPSCSAVPIVQFAEGKETVVVRDSTAILKRACPFLYPPELADEVEAWEEELDSRLGPTVRVFAYQHLLTKPALPVLLELGTVGASWIESSLFRVLFSFGVVQPNMRKFMAISEETAARSREEIDRIFTDVSEAMQGRQFIVGDRFTAADLTFASLAGPLLSTPALGAFQPPLERFPPDIQATAAALRATPAGMHALRCYEDFRFASLDADGQLRPQRVSAARRVAIRAGGPRNNVLALASAAVALVGVSGALVWGGRRAAGFGAGTGGNPPEVHQK